MGRMSSGGGGGGDSSASMEDGDLGTYATAVAVIVSQFGTLVVVSCFAGNTRRRLERKTQKRIYQFYGFCQERQSIGRSVSPSLSLITADLVPSPFFPFFLLIIE